MSPDQRGMRALTVEGWQYLVLSIMAVVVLTGAITTALLLGRTDRVSGQLTNNVGPARVAAYQLQAALRDQETAVRGYVISADPQFLAPYDTGRETESEASAELRQFEQKRPDLLDDLDAIEQAAGSWRDNYAEPVIAAVQPGVRNAIPPALTEGGKSQFDRLRVLFDEQNLHLSEARTAGIAELRSISAWRNGVLIAVLGAFLVTMVVLAIVLRRALVRPLGQLAEACRRIAGGNFGEKIAPQGPRDIRLIAIDVDNMRQRIVDELEASRAATEALDEQAEDLRRSNAELEQFAYVASHDLQEPLRKVASFCQLLEKRYGDKLDDRGTEYIAFAVDGAKRMQILINDLLTFSRVGRLNATETAVDLDAVLDDALANVATAIEETGARIERPAEGLPTIFGDPTLLTMLWQNLVGNAVKFRREGVSPRVVIDCGPSDSDQWSFSVSDNGIGIAAEFSEKVFVIFQRLHGRDAYTGTGIGLALCKKIVEHHGGTIWIDNEYTDGTRFRFTLPGTGSENSADSDTAESEAVSAATPPLMEGSSS